VFEEQDTSFRKSTLVDLYRRPDTFMSTTGVQICGLQYIDLFKIRPADGKQNLFIIYMGDTGTKLEEQLDL
jgi:hypothetical protein